MSIWHIALSTDLSYGTNISSQEDQYPKYSIQREKSKEAMKYLRKIMKHSNTHEMLLAH
jgi:hypothetical protein